MEICTSDRRIRWETLLRGISVIKLDFLTILPLRHNSMAEREQLEELQHVWVAFGADEGNKVTVGELELSVYVLVPAEVNRLQRKNLNKSSATKTL